MGWQNVSNVPNLRSDYWNNIPTQVFGLPGETVELTCGAMPFRDSGNLGNPGENINHRKCLRGEDMWFLESAQGYAFTDVARQDSLFPNLPRSVQTADTTEFVRKLDLVNSYEYYQTMQAAQCYGAGFNALPTKAWYLNEFVAEEFPCDGAWDVSKGLAEIRGSLRGLFVNQMPNPANANALDPRYVTGAFNSQRLLKCTYSDMYPSYCTARNTATGAVDAWGGQLYSARLSCAGDDYGNFDGGRDDNYELVSMSTGLNSYLPSTQLTHCTGRMVPFVYINQSYSRNVTPTFYGQVAQLDHIVLFGSYCSPVEMFNSALQPRRLSQNFDVPIGGVPVGTQLKGQDVALEACRIIGADLLHLPEPPNEQFQRPDVVCITQVLVAIGAMYLQVEHKWLTDYPQI